MAIFGIILGAIAVFAGAWVFRVPRFFSKANPAGSYDDALRAFAVIEAAEGKLPLLPEGRSRLFSHGRKTSRAFVFAHGLSNCPEQFVPLAKTIFASGANVVIPRARCAGFADRLNGFHGMQSGQDLLDQAAVGLDIAAGLGESVVLVGLSGSAVAAAWMAESRDGLDTVACLAPFFSLRSCPVPLASSIAAILSKSPNHYLWWNPKLKENNPGPTYAYPRFGTRSIANILQLARAIRKNTGVLKSKKLIIVTTAADRAANNDLTAELAARWAAANPGRVTAFQFPKSAEITHDMIDPHQPQANPDIVYPAILRLLGVPNDCPASNI